MMKTPLLLLLLSPWSWLFLCDMISENRERREGAAPHFVHRLHLIVSEKVVDFVTMLSTLAQRSKIFTVDEESWLTYKRRGNSNQRIQISNFCTNHQSHQIFFHFFKYNIFGISRNNSIVRYRTVR
jgi:hypothetical protein